MKPNPLPLRGKLVVVTRSREQGSSLGDRFEEAGATVRQIPTIELGPPDSWDSVDRAVDGASGYDWFVFTSTNGVRFLFQRLAERGLDREVLGATRIAAVGSATARELRDRGIEPAAVPGKFESAALTPLLGELKGLRVAVVRATVGRDVLIEEIRAGGGTVDLAVAYQNRPVVEHTAEVRELVARDAIDVLTFTSPSTARNFFALLNEEEKERVLRRALVCSIGPITSEMLCSLGATVAVEAPVATIDALADAILDHYDQSP